MKARIGLADAWILRGAIVFALASHVRADAAKGTAEVRSVIGVAQYAEGKGAWQTFQAGAALRPGTRLRTGVKSQVTLSFGEQGGALILAADTTLEIEQFEIERANDRTTIKVRLDLRAGTIVGAVAKMADSSRFEVKTPQTISAVKSSDGVSTFQISADGRHVVRSGSLLVVFVRPDAINQSALLHAGQTYLSPGKNELNPKPTVRPLQPSDLVELLPAGPAL